MEEGTAGKPQETDREGGILSDQIRQILGGTSLIGGQFHQLEGDGRKGRKGISRLQSFQEVRRPFRLCTRITRGVSPNFFLDGTF